MAMICPFMHRPVILEKNWAGLASSQVSSVRMYVICWSHVAFLFVEITVDFQELRYQVFESDGFAVLTLNSSKAISTEYSVVVSPQDGTAKGTACLPNR